MGRRGRYYAHVQPKLKEINTGIQRNEGYIKSLKEDKL